MTVKREHEPATIVGDLLSAEISESARSRAIGPSGAGATVRRVGVANNTAQKIGRVSDRPERPLALGSVGVTP